MNSSCMESSEYSDTVQVLSRRWLLISAKTVKSKLLSLVEAGTPPVESVPTETPWFVDGMAVLQALPSFPCNSTFACVAERVFSLATIPFQSGSHRVDFVVDQYPAVSIKNCERARRSRYGCVRTTILRSDQPIPRQWNKYLSNGDNKVELAVFLCKEWQKPKYAVPLFNRHFFATAGNMCWCLTSNDGKSVTASEVDDLCGYSHEEADTRLLLHARHAVDNGYSTSGVVIKSPDTDVVVFVLMLCTQYPTLDVFFPTGTKQRTRVIPLHTVS